MARVPCAVSCTKEFLEMVDRRAASLSMTRSAYIVQVVRQDLLTGKPNLNIFANQAVMRGNIINQRGLMVAEKGAPYGAVPGKRKRKEE